MKEYVGLRATTWAYIKDDSSEKKKSKRNKEVRNKKKTYG